MTISLLEFPCSFLAGDNRAQAASSTIKYAEAEAESSTRSTSYQDKAVLTFTPEVPGYYLIIGTAELRGSSSSYSVLARMTVDGTSCADFTGEPDQTNIYINHFAAQKVVNLTAASHTIKLQYRSESAFAYAYARRARILAIPVSSFATQEAASTQTISTTYPSYQDIVSKTFSVDAAGDYLLVSSAEFNALSSSQSIRVRTLIDAVNLGETISEAKDTTDFLDHFVISVSNLSAGSHTLKIQACNSGTTKHKARNARVTAIPLSTNGLSCQYTSAEGYVTNGGGTPYDAASLQFTPPSQDDYYILASAIVGGDEANGAAYNGYYDLTADGTSVGYEQKGFKDDTDRLSFAVAKKVSLSASAHTFKLRVWSGASAVPDAGMDNARIVALSQAPPQPVPGITGSLGKSEDGWCGAVPVYATLSALKVADYPYARAKVTTPAAQIFYAPMSWNASASRFEGVIYPGSNYGIGCADPNTGTFAVRVELDDSPSFASIDYYSDTGGFSTFVTRRKSSKGTGYDYTDFNPVWNGDHWDYSISDLVIHAASAKSNVAVAIPFHPVTSSVGNFTVKYDGTAVAQGTAASNGDCWWWEPALHTLYLQKASLSATEVDVDITFDSDTDLFATRYDRVNTADMGNREFYNGLMISNRYWTTFVYGGGHEHAGMQAESRAHEPGAPDVSTDCMERTAVHVDNVARNDGSGSYAYDIKWKQQEWMDYIASEDNGSIVVTVHSDDTAGTGWKQQLDTGIAATKTHTFYAGRRYIRQELSFVNNGSSTHTYPLVWGREQWIGSDRDTNDEGRYCGDTSDRAVESTVAMSTLAAPWMVAYDQGVFAAQGLIFQAAVPARYGYFLSAPALAQTSYEWVNYGTEYRPDDNDSGAYASNIFFDKVFEAVDPGETVTFTFWQWFYDTTSWGDIQTAIQEDSAALH
ncbi:MAG: hypothetical protein H5T73_03750 [Actinobacteria bacterium]|nr:hypothetical protein [Actinomycetota bacterium]